MNTPWWNGRVRYSAFPKIADAVTRFVPGMEGQGTTALSAVHELGYELSAFEIMANLFYPGMLLVSSLIFIFVLPDRKNAESNA